MLSFQALAKAIALALKLDDMAAMGQPVKQRADAKGVAEDLAPIGKGQVGGDQQGTLEMVQSILAEGGLHGRWVAVDELYGRSTDFLDGVAELGLWHLAEVPLNTRVWQTRPQTEVPPWSGRGR
jgi:hypothetical protein